MGIQSGSEELRHKYYERHETNEEILVAAQILAKYEVNCVYDLILDNPIETENNRKETLNLLLKLPRPFQLCTFTLHHFPETNLTKILLEKGMISENDLEDQKQLSFRQWESALDLRRSKGTLFWDNLYYLARRKHVPKRLLIWLSHIHFLKRHPKVLTFLLTLMIGDRRTFSSSKVGMIRWYLTNFPRLLFRRGAWLLIRQILEESLRKKPFKK